MVRAAPSRGVAEEEVGEGLPAGGVLALELDAAVAGGVVGDGLHAAFFDAAGEGGGAVVEVVGVVTAGTGGGDDEGAGHLRVLDPELEGASAAHGEAADVGLVDVEVAEELVEVVDGVVLAVVGWDRRGRLKAGSRGRCR